MAKVALREVTKVFPDGTVAVDDLNLDVADGEFLVLLGPSGCGKSTVLRIVAGLEAPTSGSVLLNGRSMAGVPSRERGVAMVFQDYALYPHMDVNSNIGFPLRLSGIPTGSRQERVGDVAAALGIGELLGRQPYQLSGGQQQRVAMGRALVRQPKLFLMDEPLSNLDAGLRSELRAEITNLTRSLGVSTIYVTHDQAEALTMADRVAILRRGRLQDVGTPTEVYNRPATLYVAAFLGSPRMNLIEATVYVHLDQHVALAFGGQAIYLPWHDLRSRPISRYHGERIVVGMRPEALTPVPSDTDGDKLIGVIRHLEHHGHETLAYLDVGAPAVPLEALAAPTVAATSRQPRLGRLLERVTGRHREAAPDPGQPERESVLSDPGRHHRRPAEVAVRLAPYPNIRPGQALTVALRLDALHFFDEHGDRIDVGFR